MNGPVDEAAIRAVIPHAGNMCFWQCVESWDEQQLRARTATHRDPHHPLRDAQGLTSIHLIEYGAQAMAIHGGLLSATGAATPGFLASVRDFIADRPRLDDLTDDLIVTARKLVATENGSSYEFVIDAGAKRIASGRVSAVLLAQD